MLYTEPYIAIYNNMGNMDLIYAFEQFYAYSEVISIMTSILNYGFKVHDYYTFNSFVDIWIQQNV